MSKERQRYKKFYNPLTTLGLTRLRLTGQSMNMKMHRDGFGLFFDTRYPDDTDFFPEGGMISGSVLSFGDAAESVTPISKTMKDAFDQKVGFKAMIKSWMGMPPPNSGGDSHTMTPLYTHGLDDDPNFEEAIAVKVAPKIEAGKPIVHEDTEETNTPTITKDGSLPFYFKDLRDNTYVVFRAYLDGITENITPNWESQAYIGRSEPVYSYQNTERDINFNLKEVILYKNRPFKGRFFFEYSNPTKTFNI